MDKFDVLDGVTDRSGAVPRSLLAEADDPILNQVVAEAAKALDAPIALVTLVLERMQLFKAHHGLPPDLSAVRATERSASFCQFVVRDGAPFEVTHASRNETIPQALVKRYGIQAYLGIPLRINGVVLGSLCVLDTKARAFSTEEQQRLTELSEVVRSRLQQLSDQRHASSQSRVGRVASPGLAELRASMEPIQGIPAEIESAAASALAFLRLFAFVQDGGLAAPGALDGAAEQAFLALEDLEDTAADLEVGVGIVGDCASALEKLLSPRSRSSLQEVLTAAQDLSRQPCRAVGGAPLPVLVDDIELATPVAIAVSLLSSAMIGVAEAVGQSGGARGLLIHVHDTARQVRIGVSSAGLGLSSYERVREGVASGPLEDPTVTVTADGSGLKLAFAIARPSP